MDALDRVEQLAARARLEMPAAVRIDPWAVLASRHSFSAPRPPVRVLCFSAGFSALAALLALMAALQLQSTAVTAGSNGTRTTTDMTSGLFSPLEMELP